MDLGTFEQAVAHADEIATLSVGPWAVRCRPAARFAGIVAGSPMAWFLGADFPGCPEEEPSSGIADAGGRGSRSFTRSTNHFECDLLAPARPLPPPGPDSPPNPGVRWWCDSGTWFFERVDLSCEVEPVAGHLRIRRASSPEAIDTAIRILLAQTAPVRGGLLLHGAGLRWQGGAYAFLGVSGVGKTTLATHHQAEVEIYSDEILPVSRSAAGWMAYSGPFWGAMTPKPPISAAPLARLAFLERAEAAFAIRLEPRDALARLLRCALYFAAPGGSGSKAVFETASRLVLEVPAYLLSCPPGQRFWTCQGFV